MRAEVGVVGVRVRPGQQSAVGMTACSWSSAVPPTASSLMNLSSMGQPITLCLDCHWHTSSECRRSCCVLHLRGLRIIESLVSFFCVFCRHPLSTTGSVYIDYLDDHTLFYFLLYFYFYCCGLYMLPLSYINGNWWLWHNLTHC